MWKIIIFIGSITCMCFYLYGIILKFSNVEKNECRMTYMFDYPAFKRINFHGNKHFPKYGLYYYSEGKYLNKIQHGFTGAPVIFIPGNGGSYKQVRSLASVALRKAIDISWRTHLDYFTVDLNEEYSGIYGGYLDYQKTFVKQSIIAVINSYKNLREKPSQVILIGHSMGGKIAQSLLIDIDVSMKINTVLTLSAPIDKPVINIDSYMDSFYRDIEHYFTYNKTPLIITKETNFCQNYINRTTTNKMEEKMFLDDKLLITIGGGSRDFLVDENVAHSKFSDIQAQVTAVPHVWLSTDHLCAVWCLQLVIVINRFLFSLASSRQFNGKATSISFLENKATKLEKARLFFLNPLSYNLNIDTGFYQHPEKEADWFDHSRTTPMRDFPFGINKTFIEMISLYQSEQNDILSVEALNINNNDWVFGCSSKNETKKICSKLERLSYATQLLPSTQGSRYFLTINLEDVQQRRPEWTHIALYIRPTKSQVRLTIDIFKQEDRFILVKVPISYLFYGNIFLRNTTLSTSYYKILLHDLDTMYQVFKFTIRPVSCSHHDFMLVKTCVPWIRGCEIYRFLNSAVQNTFEVFSSQPRPINYDIAKNPVVIDLHLNPKCIYEISYRTSFGATALRLVQLHFDQIPAFVLVVLLLKLEYLISHHLNATDWRFDLILPLNSILKLPVFLTISSVLLSSNIPIFPTNKAVSLLVNIFNCGIAVFCATVFLMTVWLAICCFSYLSRILRFTFTVLNTQRLLSSIPLTLIVAALCVNGGIALTAACSTYFIVIMKRYEIYLNLKQKQNCFKGSQKEIRDIGIISTQNKTLFFYNSNSEKILDVLLRQTIRNKNIVKSQENGNSNSRNVVLWRILIHITVFTTLLVLTSFNIPSIIVWTKNLRHSFVLGSDPSLQPAIFSLIPLIFIWQLPIQNTKKTWYPLWFVLHVNILYCIIWHQHQIYRLSTVINVVFVAISFWQITVLKME